MLEGEASGGEREDDIHFPYEMTQCITSYSVFKIIA